jgi:hypothetical protein
MIAILLNPGTWFPLAFALAAAWVATTAWRQARRGAPSRERVLAAMNRFYGTVIGVMALGHTLAVALKMALGTLSETTSWFALPLGLLMGVPSWWLAIVAARAGGGTRTTLVLNLLLAAMFMVMLTSAPLAFPALLNVVYQRHARRAVGVAAVGLAAAGFIAMFVASLFVSGAPM